MNKSELAVFALKRSGSHAIIHWLLEHLGPKGVHLNDVGGVDPFASCAEINARGFPLYRRRRSLRDFLLRSKMTVEYSRTDPTVDWEALRKAGPKDCLILSYENRLPTDRVVSDFAVQHDDLVGSSGTRHCVIILRDAYNLFASQFRAPYVSEDQVLASVRLYKELARAFLDPAPQMKQAVCVNFNRWFSSPRYRIELAQRFAASTHGEPFQSVPTIGGGSSFDGTRRQGRAQQMKILERWKDCRADPAYRAIFDDAELVDVSRAIFGEIVPAAGDW